MKKMSKILSVLLALALVLGLAVTASAAEGDYTITAPANGHTYEIYQIFTGELSGEGSAKVLSNIKWGKNGSGTEGTTVEQEVLTALENANKSELSDNEKLDVITGYATLTDAFETVAAGASVEVPAGYYLIKDVDDELDGTNDAYTTYIVNVVGDLTITPKSAVPQSQKKVKDIDDSTGTASEWIDSADYDIGDKVDFQLKATLPQNYDSYTVYQLTFHDEQSTGLTFDPASVKVYADGTLVESGYDVVTEGLGDECAFEIAFADLKAFESLKAGSVVTVEYQSTLNEGAAVGAAGNPNTMHIEYSNDPNDKTGAAKGATPDDAVTVFTYTGIVDKVDGDGNALAGAGFTLYKKYATAPEGATPIDAEKYADYTGYYFVKEYKADATTTQFTFAGLDDGSYLLVESETPKGYNTGDPIAFDVAATHSEESDAPALTSMTVGAPFAANTAETWTSTKKDGTEKELTSGQIYAEITNNKGSQLPSTGGIGTTIFYVVGAILVLGAGVALVVKKRAGASR